MSVEHEKEVGSTQAIQQQVKTPDESISQMRDSDIKWRAKYKMTREELETVKLQSEQQAKELSERVNLTLKEKQAVESKFVDAKLESLAISAGITDVDLVKLIDKSNVKLNEAGEIIGLTEAVQAFKQAKPNFFGAEKKLSSSSNAATITESTTKPIRAMDMSKEEYEARRRKLLSGGGLN